MATRYYRLPTGNVLALEADQPFPPLEDALVDPNGLLAVGGELTANRLLEAYQHGIFPWFSEQDPVLWWSPDPRMVLFPEELKISKSLQKHLKHADVRLDTSFRTVMESCATIPRNGQNGTWILPQMIEAYCELHRLGYAHSVEVWQEGALVGGLYGVALGRVFFGESMFHRATDASKIALVHLVKHGYDMIDCQMYTPHLASLGAREIARQEFAEKLRELVHDTAK
ncbi:MAG: leucyl/phenylalanyl-tRNA--protein transferase [Betaproteobacteria bacterium]|nr:leucyl/phenylalanyl-tRNA--protein transferase [Betaproteobacteria bacterium]